MNSRDTFSDTSFILITITKAATAMLFPGSSIITSNQHGRTLPNS